MSRCSFMIHAVISHTDFVCIWAFASKHGFSVFFFSCRFQCIFSIYGAQYYVKTT